MPTFKRSIDMKLTGLLDSAPKAIAILGFLLLLMTVLHDWGFFWIVGSGYQSIQTPYDHLANSIEWLPENLLIVAICIFVVEFPDFLKGDDEGFENVREYTAEKKIRKMRWPIFLFCVFVFALAYVTEEKFASTGFFLALMLALLTMMVFAGPALYHKLGNQRNYTFPTFLIPLLIVTAFVSGNLEAYSALSRFSDVYRVTFKGEKVANVIILRNFEKGALMWQPVEQRTIFSRWEQIDSIAHFIAPKFVAESLSCQHLGILCKNSGIIP
jgi:hypothetical protein